MGLERIAVSAVRRSSIQTTWMEEALNVTAKPRHKQLVQQKHRHLKILMDFFDSCFC